MKLIVLIAALVGMVGCSSSDKKVDASKSAPVALMSHTLSASEVSAKYSILELNSAANLLKVIVDQAGSKPSTDKGSDLIGCPLTGKQAGTMTMPLKALIDGQMKNETDAYTADPKNYANEKGFETCFSNCACGVLGDVVDAASESAMPAGAATRLHSRNKQRLSLKAKHQTAAESLACARKQAWFCTSDLKAYLEKEAKENAAEN